MTKTEAKIVEHYFKTKKWFCTKEGEVLASIKWKHKLSVPKRVASSIVKGGYTVITCKIDGISYGAMKHRLVWIYFNGDIPDGYEIHHGKDNGRINDSLDNLSCMSRTQHHQLEQRFVSFSHGISSTLYCK